MKKPRRITFIMQLTIFFTFWPFVTPEFLTIINTILLVIKINIGTYLPSMIIINASLFEIWYLQGFYSLTPGNLKWPWTRTKSLGFLNLMSSIYMKSMRSFKVLFFFIFLFFEVFSIWPLVISNDHWRQRKSKPLLAFRFKISVVCDLVLTWPYKTEAHLLLTGVAI